MLLIKTSSLGDVIHTLPAITDAAKTIAGIKFDWVVEENFAEIPSWHPVVDKVIPVALRRWRKHLWQTWRSGEWRAFKNLLAADSYDLVIDAQGLLKSAWLTHYAKGFRVGLNKHSAREPLASLFYQHSYAVAWGQHAVERIRQLFAQALGYPLPASMGDYGLAKDILLESNNSLDKYLVFLHGTTWQTKHWPEYYWRQLAEQLNRLQVKVKLPWGNAEEKARAQRIAENLPFIELLPQLNLTGIASVLAGASGCIAVDTGLGHLAAALAVPTISLFGATDPQLTGAYGKQQIHLLGHFPACVPCLKKYCNYQATEQDKASFDLAREWPLCFSQINPTVVLEIINSKFKLK